MIDYDLRPMADHHVHVCPGCATAWSHHRSLISRGGTLAAHRCPKCSTVDSDAARAVPFTDFRGLIDFREYYGPVEF